MSQTGRALPRNIHPVPHEIFGGYTGVGLWPGWVQSPTDHRLVLGAGLAAFGEDPLFGLWIEAVVGYAGEIAEAGGEAGFRVPGVNKGAALAFADQCAGALEAVELALDGVKRNGKIAGDGAPVGFPPMEKRQEHRFRRLPAKEIL